MKKYFVYILKCSDSSFYTGITNNIDKRFIEHQSGINTKSYTYSRRPLELVYFEEFQNPNDAITKEKQIKGWTRKKKQALINNNFEELKRLSNLKNNDNNTSTSSV